MIGYGVAATCFAGLGITLVIRRESGILKRIRSTPLPAMTYLLAVLGSTFLVFLIEAALIIGVRPDLLLGRDHRTPRVAARGARDRCGLLRGHGPRHHRRRAVGRGQLGGDQRDLPAGGDHLGDVLHAEGLSRTSCG